jgi:hypothetical protein
MVPAGGRWLDGGMTGNAWRQSTWWMALFAGVHVYWGLGGTALLPDGTSVVGNQTLLVIDLVAIPLCLAAAAISWLLRPGQRLSRLESRRWLLLPATLGAAVMVAHALSGLAMVTGRALWGAGVTWDEAAYLLAYEPYWLVGGLAMAATVSGFRGSLPAQSLQRKNRLASRVATAPQTTSTSHSPTRA